MPEGNESRLVCNIEKEQVIWTIDGHQIRTGADENFQPASNSTLIIKNTARDGASGGMFRVSCLGRISYATDGRIYRVHVTKGKFISFAFISLTSSGICLMFKFNSCTVKMLCWLNHN